MDKKTKRLFYSLIDFADIEERLVVKGGLSIGTTRTDVMGEPYTKELSIKLRYIDEEELKAYRDEKGTTKEG